MEDEKCKPVDPWYDSMDDLEKKTYNYVPLLSEYQLDYLRKNPSPQFDQLFVYQF